jgi:hypothetical protein
MQNTKQAFLKSIDIFKRMRIRAVEQEYDEQRKDIENDKRIDELHNKLIARLNEEAKTMLIEYVDRLVAKYNNDGGYFYDNGFSDCHSLLKLCKDTYKGQMDLPPLNNDDTIDVSELL